MTTMAPRLASLRVTSLPKTPPPPVTKAISPAILFILYFSGINNLMVFLMMNPIVRIRKPITFAMSARRDMIDTFLLAKCFNCLDLLQLFICTQLFYDSKTSNDQDVIACRSSKNVLIASRKTVAGTTTKNWIMPE